MQVKIPLMSSQKNHLLPNVEITPKWTFRMNAVHRPVSEWRTELQLAAQQIAIMAYANKHDTVYLVCDRSYESQMMIQAFLWIQAKIVVVIPRFTNNDNNQSVAATTMLCEENRIPYMFCDLDVRGFLNSDNAVEMAKKVQSASLPVLVSTLIWHTMSAADKFLVFPFGMPRIIRNDKGWMIEENTSDFGLFRVQGISDAAMKKHPGVPMFFKWCPEMVLSYLNDFLFRQVVANERGLMRFDDSIQGEIYKRYFPVHGIRNWSGFEKMEMETKRFFKGVQGQVPHSVNLISVQDYIENIRLKPESGMQAPA